MWHDRQYHWSGFGCQSSESDPGHEHGLIKSVMSHLTELPETSASGAKYGFSSRTRTGVVELEVILWSLLAAISWSRSSSPPVKVGRGCLLAIIAVIML